MTIVQDPLSTDVGLVEPGQGRTRHRSLRADVWRQFRRHKGAMAGLILLTMVVLFCIVGPFIYGGEAYRSDLSNTNLGPSWRRPMGTDELGRDVMARMMVGGRISLAVGIAAMLVSITVGTTIGILSGFFRWLDGVLMRLTDMFLALPVLPLLFVVITFFREPLSDRLGPELGVFVMVVGIIGATSWMTTARIVRGQVLAVKEKEFVIAARSIGTRRRNIIVRHLLPNVLSPVMVAAALGVAVAIITESALSFLGLGFPSTLPTWGQLLQESYNRLALAPARVIWPGALISLTVISVNFIGDGLRDALDPRLRSK